MFETISEFSPKNAVAKLLSRNFEGYAVLKTPPRQLELDLDVELSVVVYRQDSWEWYEDCTLAIALLNSMSKVCERLFLGFKYPIQEGIGRRWELGTARVSHKLQVKVIIGLRRPHCCQSTADGLTDDEPLRGSSSRVQKPGLGIWYV